MRMRIGRDKVVTGLYLYRCRNDSEAERLFAELCPMQLLDTKRVEYRGVLEQGREAYNGMA